MTDWNLIAAGPSRAHIRAEHLLEGPVVSVNRALDVVGQGITVDFAAFADGPGGCWERENLERFWSPAVQLWVTLRPVGILKKITNLEDPVELPGGPPLLKLWDRALPASVGLRVLPYGTVADADDPTKGRHAFTTLCAFRRILAYTPKRIRILSMDMAGSWIEGKTEAECHEYDMQREKLDRWKHEKAAMDRTINEARAEGIAVELVIPESACAFVPGA